MSAVTLATADEAEHDALVDLVCARLPDVPRDEAAFPFNPSFADARTIVVARDDSGSAVGVGFLLAVPFLPVTERILRVVVARESEGQGVASALRTWLLDRVPDDTTALRVGVGDDEARSLEIALHWGYEVSVHSMMSRKVLDGVTAPELPADVTIEECPTLEFGDQGAVERMFRASQTDPEALAGDFLELERLRTPPAGSTALNLLARVDGVPAAITLAMLAGENLHITYTGVGPVFRGRGLAKLVKEHLHAVGAAAGAVTCTTSNVEENAGIRRINAELGYEVVSGVYRLVKHL